MALCWAALKEEKTKISAVQSELARRLGDMTEGNAKTRRLQGDRIRAVVTMPYDNVDQTVLKEVWNSFGELCLRYLRLGRIDLNLREIKKLRNETGDDRFNLMKKMILGAISPGTASPSIKIEEIEPELSA